MNEETNSEQTPRQKFEALARRIVSVPKKDVEALQTEWKKTKHKRGDSSLTEYRESPPR